MKKVLILIVALLFLTSCTKEKGKDEEDVQINNTEEENILDTEKIATPQEGKILDISMRQPKTLNPLLNEDETVAIALRLVFENIITIDEYQNPSPNIIDDYIFSSDGKSITLNLKNNITWHDGEPIKPSDFEYSINVLKNAPESVFYKDNVKNIASTNISESSITINYNISRGENIFMLDFPIIPKHFYELSSDKLGLLGNGAYKFLEHVSKREIILEKNINFFKGTPLIDKVKIIMTRNLESDMNAFEQGVIDILSTNIINWGKYRGDKEYEIYSYTTNNYDFIGFNFKNSVFYDINLRKAIAHALPKDDIIRSIYLDYATRAEVPINPTAWFYETTLSEYTYDLDLSKQIINDSGYTKNTEDTFEKDNIYFLDFKILVNEENLERVAVADILKSNLNIVGIKSKIVALPFDEYKESIDKKDFDIVIGGYNLSIVPDLSFLLHSISIASGENIFSYDDAELDKKLEKVSESKNEIELKDSLSDLQFYMIDELPCISLAFKKSALLTDKAIYGDINPTVNNIYNNVNEWFISK